MISTSSLESNTSNFWLMLFDSKKYTSKMLNETYSNVNPAVLTKKEWRGSMNGVHGDGLGSPHLYSGYGCLKKLTYFI